MTGAALLCARASLASGAGAVSINANAATVGVYRSAPELLTSVRSSTDAAGAEEWLKHDDRFDVLVVGPGLGPDHADFVKALVESERSLVLDAGALAAARLADITRRSAPTVLTPHAAEFSRMARRPATYEAARAVAEQCGATVLLKGSPTFVADPDDLVAVTSGGPELATIGTGDVLAGMVAAFMARGLDSPVAARSAAFWHGQAGKELAASGTVTADRLIDEVRRFVW